MPPIPLTPTMSDLRKRIAARLRSLRAERALSQDSVADAISRHLTNGVSQNKVGTWERCESLPDAEEVAALANLYGVSADHVLCRSDSRHGLSPDTWIVDLDELDAPTEGGAWSIKVPRRLRVVDYQTMRHLEDEVRSRGKKGGPHGGS